MIGTVQRPPPASVGCRCWKPDRSRRAMMRCSRLPCRGLNPVTGLPSGPLMVNRKSVRLPGVSVVLRGTSV
ncbi:hypothetical protein D0T12_00905 [Actinomadura spongiicola]|uniref:Uncharacterized protein n=1 Tax=Actinomadura spongiicola TaxID=2303421 RepID=A0A372GP37_9ACTN|nr:hypothetical protein D0T12_00905 [Actinomadura spongiicola]